MITTAVVILNYNGEKLLRDFLPSVVQYSGTAKIYVIDNASTDQSLKILGQDFQSVEIIRLEENYGFCGGYNRGLKHVSADLFVLLNSDVEVTPNWLTPIAKLFEDDSTVAAAQPKILSWHEKSKFEYAGAGGGYIDALGYPFCRGRIFQSIETDTGQYNDTREIFWSTGACMIIRSALFQSLGGLDEDFFAHMEEIDLCWKIQRTPHKVMYCGSSTVYHVGAGTLSYESPQKTYLNFRNGLVLLYKHLGSVELRYKLPFRMMLDWLAALMFLLKGQRKNAASVFAAHRDFIRNINTHQKKRKAILSQYPAYKTANIYHGILPWRYFVVGKKSTIF
jgi:GT2 family glycosyltransferase